MSSWAMIFLVFEKESESMRMVFTALMPKRMQINIQASPTCLF